MTTGSSYRLGPYVLDRAGYRLLDGTRTLELTPKLLDVLFCLAERAGELVTKEELLDSVWPDANVTDNALAQAVSELRSVLGDDPAAPAFIKTVARRGYRLIAPVHVFSTAVPTVAPSTATSAVPRTAGSAVPSPAAGLPAENRDEPLHIVAVMAFTNTSDDRELAWLANGIAETVTSDLRRLGGFRVVDRRHVIEAASAAGGSMQRVADLVGADLAVLGSFQRNGSQIRVTARLVNVVTGEAIADAKVDGALDDIFRVQDEVVRRLATDLGVADAARSTAAGRDTASLDAYRAFTEGWLRLESLDLREMPRAVADLERAVAADPRYALAYAGLASGHLALYESTRADNRPRGDVLERAVDEARRAASLDPGLAEAYATLALVLVSAGQMDEASAAARRAVELEPGNWRHWFRLGHASWGDARLRAAARTLAMHPEFAFSHFQIAMVHVARGHLTEAETILRHGAAVQDRLIERGGRYPALGLHWLLGLVRLAQDDMTEAIEEFGREETFAEEHRLYGREYALGSRLGRAAALARLERFDAALQEIERAVPLSPDHAATHVARAALLGRTGNAGAAESAAARARAALSVLKEARPLEARLVQAYMSTSAGDAADAVHPLLSALDSAGPGFTGWFWPIDPALRQIAETKEFSAVRGRLAERAR